MKLKTSFRICCLGLLLPAVAVAGEGDLPFEFYNELRVGFDDNVRQENENGQESFQIIDEIELLTNADLGATFIGFRYSPIFTWWDDRNEDDTDLFHELDLSVDHEFSPRTALTLDEAFRYTEQPELIEGGDGVILRENNDFLYNTVSAGLEMEIATDTRAEFNGRYQTLQYNEDEVAARKDYDKAVGGVDVNRKFTPSTTAGAQFRYAAVSYENDSRDSDSIQVGMVLDTIVNPALLADVRAGYENKNFAEAAAEDTNAPYVSGGVAFKPGASTRINLRAGFSLAESSIDGYANQERTTVNIGVSRDLTAHVSLHFGGMYSLGAYDAEELGVVPEEGANRDLLNGDEAYYRLSLRLIYTINPHNWLELSYQYTELDSEVRPLSNFDRNRVSLGWKTKI